MKTKILFLFMLAIAIYGQSKQDILNNLQREGSITIVDANPDSTAGVVLLDSAGIKWRIKVDHNGTLTADSTGLN